MFQSLKGKSAFDPRSVTGEGFSDWAKADTLRSRLGRAQGGLKTGASAGWDGAKTGGRGAVRGAKFTTGESMKAARFVGRHKYSVPLATGLAVGGGAFLVHHRNNSSGRHDDQGIR